jgi:replicative DNA helicase
MSAGLTFIRACVDHGARADFQAASRTMFAPEEHRVLDFVSAYLQRYGQLPSYSIMLENQMATPAATGPVDYHLQRLSDRAVYTAYSERQTPLHEALRSNNMEQVRVLFREIAAVITSVDVGRDTYELAESLQDAWVAYEVARDHPGLQGMSYGWDVLDDVTGGIRGGDVATIVARPGLGKSFTITKMLVNAWLNGASVAFVSMEMTAVETARRIISMVTGVNPDFLMRGRMSRWGEEGVQEFIGTVAGRPPFTIMVGDLSKSVGDFDALLQEHSPDLSGIDASYLMQPSNKSYKGKRWEAMAEVGQEVKGVALRRNKPVIQTVQFNRSAGTDDEMDLSQIGGTDVVGQVSSAVIGMRRGPAPFERSRRRYLLLKNRHGPDNIDFLTRFEFSPFNMDVVEEEPAAADENGEWTGQIGTPPANTEWANA